MASLTGLARLLLRRVLPRAAVHRVQWALAHRRARSVYARAAARGSRPHDLPAPLYVSLTSHPARFEMLGPTLDSLLRQTVRPDGILLWIASGDMSLLPRQVAALAEKGITIRECDDVRSYKKLVFALPEHGDDYVVTADDDLFYEPGWLESLVAGVEGSQKIIVCRRAHRIRTTEDGSFAPYRTWQWEVADALARQPSVDLVATGCGGILYPPHSLHPDVTRRDLFEKLCPNADDLWFYWMARRAGSRYKVVGDDFTQLPWPDADASSLWQLNRDGENDRQIANLLAAFGNPLSYSVRS